VSFQLTILKVLAAHPFGRATLADLRRDVGILVSSGADWADRMKRLAARAPELDVFRSRFVLRDDAGWQITDSGRAFLTSLESAATLPPVLEILEVVPGPPPSAPPLLRLIGTKRRRKSRRARAPDLNRDIARPHAWGRSGL
jgi:hypothetical protein